MYRQHMLSLMLLLSVAATAVADETAAPPDTLTREQAVALALENHPAVRAAQRDVDAARGQRLQVDGFDPLRLFYDAEEARGGNPARFGNQQIGVEQEIDWPGERHKRKQVADLGIDLAQAGLARARLRVQAQAAKAFDQVLLQNRTQNLLEQAADRLTEAVEIARVRFRTGSGRYLDVLRTELAERRLRNDLRAVQLRRREAVRRLTVLLGGVVNDVSIQGELRRLPLPTEAPEPGPTFAFLEQRRLQAQRVVELARQGRYPDVILSIASQRLYYGGVADQAVAGGIGLRLPLPGSDLQRGREAEARAQAQAVQERAALLATSARAQLRQRVDDAKTLLAQVETYEQRILPDVEDELKVAQQDYRVGRIDALNLIDVYRTYLDARQSYLALLTDYRAAVADLETAGEDLWEITL